MSVDWAQNLSNALISPGSNGVTQLLQKSLGSSLKSAVEEYELAMASVITAAAKSAAENHPVDTSNIEHIEEKDVEMSVTDSSSSSSVAAVTSSSSSSSTSGIVSELETVIVIDDARGRLVSTLHEIIDLAIYLKSASDSVPPLSPQAFLALL